MSQVTLRLELHSRSIAHDVTHLGFITHEGQNFLYHIKEFTPQGYTIRFAK